MQPLLERLWSIARRTRLALLTSRTGVLVAISIAAVIVAIAVDALFRWPSAIRWVVLAMLVAGLLTSWRRRIRPAWSFRPTPIDIALRIERDEGSLRGRLASAVDMHLAGTDRSDPFAAAAVASVASSVDAETLRLPLRTGPIRRGLVLGGIAVAMASIAMVALPETSRTGLERTFMPWTDAAWPARTGVSSLLEHVEVAARSRPFTLAASLDKGNPDRDRVEARFRLERNGELGAWERIVLTRQSGRRFERRVSSDADAIEFMFETDDDATSTHRIRFVPAPEVADASILIEPPDYAKSVRPAQRFELGPGTDRRAEVPAAQLVGSQATLRFELTKPLPPPPTASIQEILVGAPAGAELLADPENPEVWMLSWRLERSTSIRCALRDEHGLESNAGATFSVAVTPDHDPSVAILVPQADEAVLPTAVVAVDAEARDDLEIVDGGIEVSRSGGASTPIQVELDEAGPRRSIRAVLSIESIGGVPGDVVELVATALDGMPGREPVRSSSRRLSIVDEDEFIRAIRDDFAAVRQLAIRADGEQAELLEALETAAESGTSSELSELRARQAGVSRRVDRIAEGVQSLADRLERNRLDDDRQRSLAEEVTRRAEAAADASTDAEQALGRASESGSASDSTDSEAGDSDRSEAESKAGEVRRELEGLVAALDRDEDTWALERELERLGDSLEALADDSEAFGRETVGQTPEEMSEADRRDHEELVRRQQEIGDAAERLLSDLDERSRRLEERDVGQAEALRQAAESGRQSGLERSLDEAERSLEGNRTDQAAEAQRQAAEALERMGRQLEDTRKVRTETLGRLMTELIESIEVLLAQSESEAFALRDILAAGVPWSRPAIMKASSSTIQLERNTRSVSVTASSGGTEAEGLVSTLDRAATAQGEAIVALREQAPRVPDASASMERSSGLLREAIELARRLGENAEREAMRQQRLELASSYRELAALQKKVADETTTLSDRLESGEISRRRLLLETRRQADRQDEVAVAASEISTGIEGLSETAVFAGGHDWIDRWSREASGALERGEMDAGVASRQRRIATTAIVMAEAVEALAEDDERFAGGENGSGGSGSGGGGAGGGDGEGAIPPISELRLLRSLQESVYLATRALDDRRGPDGPDSATRRRELEELAEMQRSIIEFGNRLLEALEQQEGEGAAPPDRVGGDPLGVLAPGPLASSVQDAVVSPPSLDDLLGIDDEESHEQSAKETGTDIPTALDERLREKPIADGFRQALSGMVQSEEALADREDTGLATQRIQESVLRNLQALIESARRQRQEQQQQSQGSSSSSSSSESSPQPSDSSSSGSRSSRSGERQADGESGEASTPAFEEAELGGMLEEGRVEWGRLPDRVRELIRQGRRDRISSIYRRLTEQYYRRLAEEGTP